MNTYIPTDRKPTALYRLFGSDRQLLYVGISTAPKVRWTAHATEQSWWPQVTEKTVEWYDDRATALEAETSAIKAELPKYNVQNHPVNGPNALQQARQTAQATYRRKRGARRFIPIIGSPTREQQLLIQRVADMVRPLRYPRAGFRRI